MQLNNRRSWAQFCGVPKPKVALLFPYFFSTVHSLALLFRWERNKEKFWKRKKTKKTKITVHCSESNPLRRRKRFQVKFPTTRLLYSFPYCPSFSRLLTFFFSLIYLYKLIDSHILHQLYDPFIKCEQFLVLFRSYDL